MNKYARFIKDHIWGPTGSIIVHLIILFVLVRYVVLDQPAQDEAVVEIEMEVVTPPEPLEDFDVELDDLDDTPDVVETVDIPVVDPDTDPPVMDTLEVSAAEAPDFSNIAEAESPIRFRDVYAGRTGAGRDEGLRVGAGRFGEETEAAVMRALRWLKAHQYADGSWGPEYRSAMTGLALLTFLAHGETTGSEEFGDAVRRGLRYLVAQQDVRGWFRSAGRIVHQPGLYGASQRRVYEHVIATYAIAEAYGLTGIPFLRYTMEDAVQVILDGQLENGGWAYGFDRDGPQHIDVSLGGWIIQTLKAAELAEADNRGLRMAIENGIYGIRTMTDPMGSGLFGYSGRVPGHDPDHTMTGVAVLAMQLTGYVQSEEAVAGVRALSRLNFNWAHDPEDPRNDRDKVGRWPLYAWYYITQARFQFSRDVWRPWNRQFAPGMSRTQNPDGSWCPPPGSVEGAYGPVYNTAFPALMLQVYYRLLPTFQTIPEVEEDDPLTDPDLDDFTIRLED